MKSFYRNLKNGDSKHIALRKANLTYLNSTTDETLKHPYYLFYIANAHLALGDTKQAIPLLEEHQKFKDDLIAESLIQFYSELVN